MNLFRVQIYLKSFLLLVAVPLMGAIGLASSVSFAGAQDFMVLCYHDVSKTQPGDAYGVTLAQLKEQFEYLKKNHKVVSIDDILSASQGKSTLPPNAVLITFDDGLASFYELVYPLLKQYQYPAVFAVVGKWINEGKSPDYGYVGANPPMTTWKQLKEMSDSGLVAVVSHSYNLHQGHIFNPQGNEQASAGFLKYYPETKTYESEKSFYDRVKTDLQENDRLIRKHIGKSYPIMVWPYGTFNGLSQKAATELGMSMQFSIEPGLNSTEDLSFIRRGMVLASFTKELLAEAMKSAFVYRPSVRAVFVDVDSVWAGSEEASNLRLGKLNDRAAEVRPNMALIQTLSGKGEAYFPTSVLPLKASFFPRVAHVLQNRARVEKVYATVPLKYLKRGEVEKLIHDLAVYSDIDGIFIDARGFKGTKGEDLVDLAMKTGSQFRPSWSYGWVSAGISVDVPKRHSDKFKYIIQEFEISGSKEVLGPSLQSVHRFQDSKMIVAISAKNPAEVSKSYEKLRGLGMNNFFLPLSFNSYEDLSFLKANFHTELNPFVVH